MTVEVPPGAPVVLLRGSDPTILGDALHHVIEVLAGDEDHAMAVDEVGAARLADGDGAWSLGPLVDAAQTLPFLTARRVVVGRALGGFTKAAEVAPLVDYLADPLPTTSLVLVWERPPVTGATLGRIPKSLREAVEAAGGVVIDTDPGQRPGDWIRLQLRQSPLSFSAVACDHLVAHLGEDAPAVVGLLETLVGVYGEGASLDVDDIAPYLPEAGGVPPWDLTDAVDRGEVTAALEALHRQLHGGGRHPLQVIAILQRHVGQLLALDGAAVADEKAAAKLLGMTGSTFPARKALEQSRRLDSARIAELVELVARADLDVRGARAWPPELTVEVLVARLASRMPRRRSRR